MTLRDRIIAAIRSYARRVASALLLRDMQGGFQLSQPIGWLLTTEGAGRWFIPDATLTFGSVAIGTPAAARFSPMSMKNQRTLLTAVRGVLNAYSNTFNFPIVTNIAGLLLRADAGVRLQACFNKPLEPICVNRIHRTAVAFLGCAMLYLAAIKGARADLGGQATDFENCTAVSGFAVGYPIPGGGQIINQSVLLVDGWKTFGWALLDSKRAWWFAPLPTYGAHCCP